VAALVSLLITIALSLLITRIATLALTMTGLSRDLAKFQSRSAFTGVGFTTQESEKIVSHPVRRRILMVLMLLGNAGVVTAISSLVLTFTGATGTTGQLFRFGAIALGLALIWVLSTSRWVNRTLSHLIDWALKHWVHLNVRDYASLLHLSGDYQVSEMQISPNDWLADKRLSELNLRQEGVMILGIQRGDGAYIGAPTGQTSLRVGDVLILYGRFHTLAELDSRRADITGEVAHQNAVAEQQRVVSAQHEQDTESRRPAEPQHSGA
jgi:hypothetical protein